MVIFAVISLVIFILLHFHAVENNTYDFVFFYLFECLAQHHIRGYPYAKNQDKAVDLVPQADGVRHRKNRWGIEKNYIKFVSHFLEKGSERFPCKQVRGRSALLSAGDKRKTSHRIT